jgi:hypothetical protein
MAKRRTLEDKLSAVARLEAGESGRATGFVSFVLFVVTPPAAYRARPRARLGWPAKQTRTGRRSADGR